MQSEQHKVLFNRHFIIDQTDTNNRKLLGTLYACVWLSFLFGLNFKLQVVLFD